MNVGTELGNSLARFVSVGVVSSAIYVLAVAALVELLHVDPKLASGLAYVLALPVNFLGNRNFTFQSTGNIASEICRFLIVHGINIGIATLSMYWAVEYAAVTYWVGSAMAVLFVPISTFLIMKLWVFADRA